MFTIKASLRELMDKNLSETEVKAISFDLEIDYENLDGRTKKEKIISLLNSVNRKCLNSNLELLLKKANSTVKWNEAVFPLPEVRTDEKWILTEKRTVKIMGIVIFESVKEVK